MVFHCNFKFLLITKEVEYIFQVFISHLVVFFFFFFKEIGQIFLPFSFPIRLPSFLYCFEGVLLLFWTVVLF